MKIRNAINVHDMGELSLPTGEKLLERKLLRGEAAWMLGRDGTMDLMDAGLVSVLDLRNESERAKQGHGAMARYFASGQVKLFKVDLSPSGPWRDTEAGKDPYVHLDKAYAASMNHAGEALMAALNEIIDLGGMCYMHGAIGKDRTAMVSAVLASELGVDRDDIIEDYLKPVPVMKQLVGRLADDPNYPEFKNPQWPALTPRPRVIASMLDQLETEGSTAEWIKAHGGDCDKINAWLKGPVSARIQSLRFGDRRGHERTEEEEAAYQAELARTTASENPGGQA